MFENLVEELENLKIHYRILNKVYDKYQKNKEKETANFSETSKILLSRADKTSTELLKQCYLDRYKLHKAAFDELKQTIPTNSKTSYILQHISDKQAYIPLDLKHKRCLREVEEIVIENSRSLAVIDLFASYEDRLHIGSQNSLTRKYHEDLSPYGVCDGFLTEWARFYSKHKDGQKNFIDKLNAKLSTTDHPEKFLARVQKLQNAQDKHKNQLKDFYYTNTKRWVDNVREHCSKKEDIILQAISYLNNQQNNDVVAIDYRRLGVGAHAVGIRCERDDTGGIKAFIFYDPNYGEIPFDGADKEHRLADFFEKWSAAMNIEMEPVYKKLESNPPIAITLETEAVRSRIDLLAEKKKEKLSPTSPVSIRVTHVSENLVIEQNTPSADETFTPPRRFSS